MIKKLRVKFICVNMVIVTVMLLLLFGTVINSVRVTTGRVITEALRNVLMDPTHVRPFLRKDDIGLQWFLLERQEDGGIHAVSSGSFDLSDEAMLEDILTAAEEMETPTGVLPQYDLRYLRADSPAGTRVCFSDLGIERLNMRGFYRGCLIAGALGFAVFFVISVLLARWAVKPVDEAWRQQKQFVADASHELKTPLTVIMSNAELLQQPGYDEAQRKQFSDSILAMSRQMRHLVESLLDLARLDSAGDTGELLKELDFSALTEDCLLPFEALYFEHGLLLESQIEPGLRVKGAERTLSQCVEILLDNAQKYSEPGTVLVCLQRSGRHCELTVSNPFPELSRSECRDIFKRFYRRDEARTGSGSYGLGLPIAEGIVARHGGKIGCDWAGGQIRFTVTLPLA